MILLGTDKSTNPLVAILLGSTSDADTMEPARQILKEFDVSCEVKVLSAHRTPEQTIEYAKAAKGRGIKVIIAGAGGAAHLAGIVAAVTTLPVIGVPVKSKTLNGFDSLLSMVQMPAGIPVATVAIDGALNAGLLALEILALSNSELSTKLDAYRTKMQEKVLKSSA
ncbi:MAG: 5-(carboxyamino)imidazole ribonucleotide mutase [Bacteroidota bacterium]|jgi:5-(carboxyamino)imidazole ribonucleotide mutase